jgi:predicted ATP-grasp superfamily ATP-dependent carboligase
VTCVHRCPPIATDPKGYLEFALDLLNRGSFDVLLPIHEQGYVFTKALHRIPKNVGVALPSFESYSIALDKARFSELLAEIGVPQPKTRTIGGIAEIPTKEFPYILKRPMSTASRSVQPVRDKGDVEIARAALAGPGELLVQELIDAPVEHAQAVFDRGRFVAMHCYRRILLGAGGGEALKESVHRPRVRTELEKIAKRLGWHGAFSFDYLWKDGVPYFVDSNPRLVEPMSAHFAGLDILGALLDVSRGKNPSEFPASRAGVRTRLSLQALLGKAQQTHSRWEIIKEIFRFCTSSGIYEGSKEEFTPVKIDWMAVVPVGITAFAVLLHPGAGRILPEIGWGSGLLTPKSIRIIRDEIE